MSLGRNRGRDRSRGHYRLRPTGPAPSNTIAPAASGTVLIGNSLSTDNGTWANTPTSFSYQWKRDGSNIASATSSSYTVVVADIGHSITCAVTATNASGSASATSNALTYALANSGTFTTDMGAESGITQSGGFVSAWANAGTGGGTYAQATGANQPAYATNASFGGLHSLNFDGINDVMTATGNAGKLAAAFTLVMAVQPPSVASAYVLTADNNNAITCGFSGKGMTWFFGGGTEFIEFGTTGTTAVIISAQHTDGGNFILRVNGVQTVSQASAATLAALQLSILGEATAGTAPADVKVHRFLIAQSAISTNALHSAEAYLGSLTGITVS